MWQPVEIKQAPGLEPLSVADAKAHLRVDDDDSNALITAEIAVARDHVERETGTYLITQDVEAKATGWGDLESLPFAPVQSVAISYVDSNGDAQTLSTDVYDARLAGLQPSIVLKTGQAWPPIQSGSQITVTATVGYGDAASDVPPSLIQSMKLILADLHEHRGDGDGDGVPPAARTMLQNHRRFWL